MGCKKNNRCCCDGCSAKPFDRNSATSAIRLTHQYCCSCIPSVICVSSSADSGVTWRSKHVGRNCNFDPADDEDPLQYYTTILVDGELRLINVRFRVGEGSDTCCNGIPVDGNLGITGDGLSSIVFNTPAEQAAVESATASIEMVFDAGYAGCLWQYDAQTTATGFTCDVHVDLEITVNAGNPDLVDFYVSYTITTTGTNAGTGTVNYEAVGVDPSLGIPVLSNVGGFGPFFYFGASANSITWDSTLTVASSSSTPCAAAGTNCWLTWDIPALGISGERLMDHEELHDAGPYCEEPCQEKTAACCDFGGEWLDVANPYGNAVSIRIAKAPLISLRDEIGCGCCSCICKCACLSVYTRNNNEVDGGTFTGATNSGLRCSELVVVEATACDGRVVIPSSGSVTWEESTSGFQVVLKGKESTALDSYFVDTGTEVTPTCDVHFLLLGADSEVHEITGASGSVVARYIFDTKTPQPASRFAWAGWSEGEDSSIQFEAWNWTTGEWDSVGAPVEGRPPGYSIPRYVLYDLDAEHTGTGANEGFVRLRVTGTNADRVINDMIRIDSPNSCKLHMVPPDGVGTITGTIDPVEFGELNDCPVPSRGAQWAFTDTTNNYDYIVNWECSICNDGCGTQAAGGCCAGSPVAGVLLAEVVLGCAGGSGCDSAFYIPLIRPFTGSIWTGVISRCGHDNVTMTLTCQSDGVGGQEWLVNFSGIGSCSFSGTAPGNAEDCPPLDLTFSGNYASGIGCCGTGGGAIVTIPITINITE